VLVVTARRASVSAVVLTILTVGVMLVMIMLAARTGPQRIIHGTLRDPSIAGVNPSYSLPTRPPNPGGRSRLDLIHGNHFLHVVGWVIRMAIFVCIAWGLYRGARRLLAAFADRRRPPPRPEHLDFDVLDDPEPMAEEMRRDAADQISLLLGGTPRNAIVACWDRFEEQAERVHVARNPWETSSEFTLRLLDRVSADAPAVSRLERLYREARFSEHEIGESRREAALEALEAIHASLGVRSVDR
jgi:Domain of unknown function (DUF4129)